MSKPEYNILLIDDSEDDYRFVRTLLDQAEQAIFHLTWIDNGAEGIIWLERTEHDVFLVNSQLAGEPVGLDLLRIALQASAASPFVLLTDQNDRSFDRQALVLGASDCLCKDDSLTSRLLERSILHALERKQAATELREITERLMLAKTSAQLGIWEYDVVHDRLVWDDRTCELYDLNPQEFTGKKSDWETRIHPQDLPLVQEHLQDCLTSQHNFHLEFRVILLRGRTRHIEAHALVIGNPLQGQRMIGVNRDISDRKETEVKLQYMNRTLEQRIVERTESLKGLNALLKKQSESFYNTNQLLNLVMNSIPQGIFWKNRESMFLGGNQRFADDVGSSIEALKGKDNASLPLTSEEIEFYTQCDRDVMETGQPMIHFLTTFQKSNGSTVHIDMTKVPLRNKSGQIIGILGCYEDVSDRKWAELERQKLLQELSAFKTAIDRSASIAITDENGVILEANDRFCIISGYERSELLGQTHALIKSNYHPPEFYQKMWQTLRNGQIWQGEICNRSKTGQIYWEESSIVPLFDAQDNPSRYLAIRYDISSRKKAEQATQHRAEQEKLLREISQRINQSLDLDSIFEIACHDIRLLLRCDRVCIFKFDDFKNGVFVAESFSEQLKSLLNIELQASCFGETQLKIYESGEILVIHHGEEQGFVPCLRQLLGQFNVQSGLIFPLRCNDRLWGLLCIYQGQARHWKTTEIDFTQQLVNELTIGIQQASLVEQLQQELRDRQSIQQELAERNQQLGIYNDELLRATRLKDEFLASMSHELRTPLNAILGMSEILQEDLLGSINPEQRDALQTIQRSGVHLLELINDILDVAKIESGQLELYRKPVSLPQLCQSSLALVQHQALQKKIEIQYHIPESTPSVLLDERRIRQVLVNLLNNAVKFTGETGTVSLRVTLSQIDDSNPDLYSLPSSSPCSLPYSLPYSLQFIVQDTGIGIAPEHLCQLFQPFMQIDSALNRQYAGTGLGLALVKRVVELHAGTVTVTSEVGVGSCFTVTLPCQISEDSYPPESSSIVPVPVVPTFLRNTNSPIFTILLAEDNATNVNTLKIYLESQGYQILFAQNGAEAIVVTQSYYPDLILMDIQMPVVDGLQAIQILRRDPDFEKIPIIALTALTMPGDRERCLDAGATDYMAKPVQLKDLEACIQKHLKH